MVDSTQEKTERNARVQARYDELLAAGEHGHYKTLFRVVREEVERERARWAPGLRIGVPTRTMEQEFANYERRGMERERSRCWHLCLARMDVAERESGPEAAGHLEAVATMIRDGATT
jgi:Ni/Co efflux regulator RcnB